MAEISRRVPEHIHRQRGRHSRETRGVFSLFPRRGDYIRTDFSRVFAAEDVRGEFYVDFTVFSDRDVRKGG